MMIRTHRTLPVFGLLCAVFGLAAFALAWTPLTLGCTAVSIIVVGSRQPRGPPCVPYTDGGLPFVLQSDPPTGTAIVAAALLAVAVALGVLWFRRRHSDQARTWSATSAGVSSCPLPCCCMT
jgi:hypothetical protein